MAYVLYDLWELSLDLLVIVKAASYSGEGSWEEAEVLV